MLARPTRVRNSMARPPVLAKVIIVKNCIINKTFFTYKISKDGIKAAAVTISRRQETLRCSGVSPFSKGCDKSREVAIGLTQWYTVITIPSVYDSFPSVSRYAASKMKWRLGSKRFTLAKFFER